MVDHPCLAGTSSSVDQSHAGLGEQGSEGVSLCCVIDVVSGGIEPLCNGRGVAGDSVGGSGLQLRDDAVGVVFIALDEDVAFVSDEISGGMVLAVESVVVGGDEGVDIAKVREFGQWGVQDAPIFNVALNAACEKLVGASHRIEADDEIPEPWRVLQGH